jgi:hypothetical protein
MSAAVRIAAGLDRTRRPHHGTQWTFAAGDGSLHKYKNS